MPFILLKIRSIGIYTGFCAVIKFLKSCRKFLFLDLLQFFSYGFLDLSNICKVESFLTSFSTWGTENSLVEINLESTVG